MQGYLATVITPWKNIEELVRVRALLYPEASDSGDEHNEVQRQKRLGINIIHTWKLRTKVPHAITATASLIDATIVHAESLTQNGTPNSNSNMTSPNHILYTYATSFSRFVTSFCDTPHASSKTTLKKSMYDVAADLHMPEHWVELRHEITHGEMPSLRTLEACTNEAIGWLWENHWVGVAPQRRRRVGGDAGLRDGLKALVRGRKEGLRARRGDEEVLGLEEVLEWSGREVVSVLVESKMLLPSRKSSSSNMDAAYLIWDVLLQRIADVHSGFYGALVMALVKDLCSWTSVEPEQDVEKRAMFHWIEHLIIAKTWSAWRTSSFAQEDIRSDIMEECLLVPSVWTSRLSKLLLDNGSEKFRQDWSPFFDTSDLQPVETQSHDLSKEVDMLDSDKTDLSNSVQQKDALTKQGGWKRWQGEWTPRPIGV